MNAILARQPYPSPTVAALLKRPPRLLINGEWADHLLFALLKEEAQLG